MSRIQYNREELRRIEAVVKAHPNVRWTKPPPQPTEQPRRNRFERPANYHARYRDKDTETFEVGYEYELAQRARKTDDGLLGGMPSHNEQPAARTGVPSDDIFGNLDAPAAPAGQRKSRFNFAGNDSAPPPPTHSAPPTQQHVPQQHHQPQQQPQHQPQHQPHQQQSYHQQPHHQLPNGDFNIMAALNKQSQPAPSHQPMTVTAGPALPPDPAIVSAQHGHTQRPDSAANHHSHDNHRGGGRQDRHDRRNDRHERQDRSRHNRGDGGNSQPSALHALMSSAAATTASPATGVVDAAQLEASLQNKAAGGSGGNSRGRNHHHRRRN